MLRVGSLSRSIGWTTKKRTPSRSGVFFVDQTVPMTLPRNIKSYFVLGTLSFEKTLQDGLSTKYEIQSSSFCEHLCRVADIARRRRDDRLWSNVNLFAFLN